MNQFQDYYNPIINSDEALNKNIEIFSYVQLCEPNLYIAQAILHSFSHFLDDADKKFFFAKL